MEAETRSRAKRARSQLRPLFLWHTNHTPDAFRGIGHHRIDQRRGDPQCVGRVEQRRVQLRTILRFLRKRPGLTLDDVLIERVDEIPRCLQRDRDLEGAEMLFHCVYGDLDLFLETAIQFAAPVLRRLRNHAAAIARDHRGRAAHDIPEVVGEIRIEPGQHAFVGEVGVLPERHLAHDEIAQCIDTKHADVVFVARHVADRLRHLRAAHQPPAVSDDPARRRNTRGHQEAGQYNRAAG